MLGAYSGPKKMWVDARMLASDIGQILSIHGGIESSVRLPTSHHTLMYKAS